jgi:hypothetical protein
VLPDLTSVSAPFRNLEIEWRQGKKTLSRDEPTNSRPNSKQPAKARKGLVLFSNGRHLNSSTDDLPSRGTDNRRRYERRQVYGGSGADLAAKAEKCSAGSRQYASPGLRRTILLNSLL